MLTTEKLLEPWHVGTYLVVLSESYAMNTNMIGFIWFSKFLKMCVLVLWAKVDFALEGLKGDLAVGHLSFILLISKELDLNEIF